MLDSANVKKEDVVYDLGSGDGRILIAAAKAVGCKAVGYELDAELVAVSRRKAQAEGVAELVTVRQADIFTADLKDADVVALYLLPQQIEKLVPQLNQMKPGSRVVSHQFEIPGVKADQVLELKSDETGAKHTLYISTTPLKTRQK